MKLSEIIEHVKEAQQKYFSLHVPKEELKKEIEAYLQKNTDLLTKAYMMDSHEELSIGTMMSQLEIEEMKPSESFKNEFGKVTNVNVPYGVLAFISDSNPYHVLRMIVLALESKNGMVIHITHNVGTNYLLVEGIKDILHVYGIENLIELYNNNADEKIEENEEIDAFVYIGKKLNAERFKVACTKPVIYSGCGQYELYVEDLLDNELVQRISQNASVKIYSKGLEIGQKVKSMEEAIARIDETGNGYSVGIITKEREHAKEFVDRVKARNVFVNSSPTLINSLDISIKDLMYPKSVLVYDEN